MEHLLMKTPRVKKTPSPILAIDFENDVKKGAISGFLCAHIYGDYETIVTRKKVKVVKQVDRSFDKLSDVHDFILSLKYDSHARLKLVAYNYNYDLNFLFDILDDKETLYNKSNFVRAKTKNGILLYDIANYAVGGVAAWIETLDLEKTRGITKIEDESGNVPDDLNVLKARCRNDAAATYWIARFFSDALYSDWGVSFKPTAPSAALGIFTTNFFNYKWSRPDDLANKHERFAYYGGRTEMFKRGIFKNIKSYDVNSMYPAVMKENRFPDPTTAYFHENGDDWKEYINRFDGIYYVRLRAPMMYVQVLPYRNYHNPEGRLLFPSGKIEGAYCTPELREALKEGYTIEKCTWFITYSNNRPYFAEFVDTFYNERMQAKKNGEKARAEYLKRILVSLYGKFGEQRGVGGYTGSLEGYDGDVVGKTLIPYKLGNLEMITVAANGTPEEALHSFPVIAAFVTSYARLKLYRLLKKYQKWIIACDTDSLKVTEDCPDIESDQYALGALKDETSGLVTRNVAFIKVKCYMGADPMLKNGVAEIPFDNETDLKDYPPELIYPSEKDKKKNVITIKGVGKRAEVKFNFANRTIEAYDFQPIRTKTGIVRQIEPCIWRDTHKVLDIYDEKRIWVGKDSKSKNLNMW